MNAIALFRESRTRPMEIKGFSARQLYPLLGYGQLRGISISRLKQREDAR